MSYPRPDPYYRFEPTASIDSVSNLVQLLSKGLDQLEGDVCGRGVSPRLADIMAWRALIENGGLEYVTWWMHCDTVLWKGETDSRTYQHVPKAFDDLRSAEQFTDAVARSKVFKVHGFTLSKRSFGKHRLSRAELETEFGVHETPWCETEGYALSLAVLAAYTAALRPGDANRST
jgi:hypothetical protein